MVLDSDLVLLLPARVHPDWITDGRAMYTPEPAAAHPEWHNGARCALQTACNPPDSPHVLSVTPELLTRTIALQVLCRLQQVLVLVVPVGGVQLQLYCTTFSNSCVLS